MGLFAIGDLHLGFSVEKPMDIFGDEWKSHENLVKKNWEEKITDEDTVLLPGDISWAMKFNEAYEDLKWIDELPGKKIILKGNHDYWWASLKKMNGIFESIDFLHNNFYVYEDIAICGTRGWVCPNDNEFTEHDEKMYKKEAIRLRISLDAAKEQGYKRFVVMMHYPAANDKVGESLYTEIIKEYKPEKVIYAHLHSSGAVDYTKKGIFDEIEYILVSSDYINFNPVKLY